MTVEPKTKQIGFVDVFGRMMHGDDWPEVKQRQREQERMYQMSSYLHQGPPPPSNWVLSVVGLIALFLMGTATYYAHVDAVIAITYAILSLGATTVWCCLYMARR
jgi:hypothetical protein